MAETITVTGDNLTLDLLLVRAYGLSGQTLVGEALLLNKGLAALGPVLPVGTVITLPDKPKAKSVTETVSVVSLFGDTEP